MVDAVLQGVWVLHFNNYDTGDESLPPLAFRRHVANAVFMEYLKEGKLSSSYAGQNKTLLGAI